MIKQIDDNPGVVCTLDALHAVKETCEIIVSKGMDFLICVKGNAASLQRTIADYLKRREKSLQHSKTSDCKHGRIEHRELSMHSILPWQANWPHVHTVIKVTRHRAKIRQRKRICESTETIHYIASFPADKFSPEKVLLLVRGHWQIENTLHHRKDRSMDEDRNRASISKTGRFMCYLRSVAAQIFRRTKESMGVVQKRFINKTGLVLNLLRSHSLQHWENKHQPYMIR